MKTIMRHWRVRRSNLVIGKSLLKHQRIASFLAITLILVVIASLAQLGEASPSQLINLLLVQGIASCDATGVS